MYVTCKIEDRKCPLGYAKLMFPMTEKDFNNLMLFAGYKDYSSLAITEIEYLDDGSSKLNPSCRYCLSNVLFKLQDFEYSAINHLATNFSMWSISKEYDKLCILGTILYYKKITKCSQLDKIITDIETLTIEELIKKYPTTNLKNNIICRCGQEGSLIKLVL